MGHAVRTMQSKLAKGHLWVLLAASSKVILQYMPAAHAKLFSPLSLVTTMKKILGCWNCRL